MDSLQELCIRKIMKCHGLPVGELPRVLRNEILERRNRIAKSDHEEMFNPVRWALHSAKSAFRAEEDDAEGGVYYFACLKPSALVRRNALLQVLEEFYIYERNLSWSARYTRPLFFYATDRVLLKLLSGESFWVFIELSDIYAGELVYLGVVESHIVSDSPIKQGGIIAFRDWYIFDVERAPAYIIPSSRWEFLERSESQGFRPREFGLNASRDMPNLFRNLADLRVKTSGLCGAR